MDVERLKAMFAEAKALSHGNRDEDAEAIYRAILKIIPNDPIPAYNLATTLLRQGKYEEGFYWYEARAYLGSAKLVKPIYRPTPLSLPAGCEEWGAQTLAYDELRSFLAGPVDQVHDDAPSTARS